MEKEKTKTFDARAFFATRNITVAAALTAISYILYMVIKFPLPFFPSFLDMQFSDMPALIGGFMLGPAWGCIIILLKGILKMPFSGTWCVGELADILIGIAFVLPSALVYRRYRTKKGALAALGLGAAFAVVMALLANACILVPVYSVMIPGGWGTLVRMMAPLFPSIQKETFMLYYLPLSILPFNILRCAVCALITFLLYKQLQRFVHYLFRPREKQSKASFVRTPTVGGKENAATIDGGTEQEN